jgi:hypothetical protein
VDGIMGPQTRSAIRSFQQQRGLQADGRVGPQTEHAMIAAGAGPAPATTITPQPREPARPAPLPAPVDGARPAGALAALRSFVAPETLPTLENALNIMKIICQYQNIPWRIGYTILQHEGGIRLFKHGDGVMQTTRPARQATIPRLPRELKLILLGRSTADPASDQELNRLVDVEFRRRLAVQIATGVQELKTNLLRFNNYVALAFIAYNAGPGWAYYVITRGQRKQRPGGVSEDQWENMCRSGAALYHQPPDKVRIEEGVWQCDSNIPAWFSHMPVFDRQSNIQLIAYKYLRRIRECMRGPKPSVASCTSATHRQRRKGTGPLVCTLSRFGALDKLYNPRLMSTSYYAVAQNELPPIPADNMPLKAVGQQLVKMPLA